jgi:hypothetical protein
VLIELLGGSLDVARVVEWRGIVDVIVVLGSGRREVEKARKVTTTITQNKNEPNYELEKRKNDKQMIVKTKE